MVSARFDRVHPVVRSCWMWVIHIPYIPHHTTYQDVRAITIRCSPRGLYIFGSSTRPNSLGPAAEARTQIDGPPTLERGPNTSQDRKLLQVFFFIGPLIFCITILAGVATTLVKANWSPALTLKCLGLRPRREIFRSRTMHEKHLSSGSGGIGMEQWVARLLL